MFTKIFVLILFLIVVASLVSALFFMMRDTGNSKRMVRALTMRISISILAFILLLLFGGIPNPSPF